MVNKKEVRTIPETFSSFVRPLYEPLLSPLKTYPTDKGNFPRSHGQLVKQMPVFLERCKKCHHVTIPEKYAGATWQHGEGSKVPFFPAPSIAMTHIWQENREA